jgi:transmembrane protein 231
MENQDGKEILCTSFELFQQFNNETERCSKIKVAERDISVDGFADELVFTVEFATFHDYGIKSASIVLFLDARLYEQCAFRVPTAVVLKKIFKENFNNRRILIDGKLEAEQDQALVCPFFMRNVKSHFFFEKLNENQTDLEEYEISTIKDQLAHNPMYFKFHETSTDLDELDDDKTSIRIRMKIPEIPIRYKKSFWQKLMDSWMQFLSLFAITFTIINFLLGHLFENRFIMSRRKNYVKDKEF